MTMDIKDRKSNTGIKVEYENDLTIYTIIGQFQFQDFMTKHRKFYSEKPTKYVLFDATNGQFDEIKTEDVEHIAEFMRSNVEKRPKNAKTAIVVKGMSDFGMTRMYQIWMEIKQVNIRTKIFSKKESALKWIHQENEIGGDEE